LVISRTGYKIDGFRGEAEPEAGGQWGLLEVSSCVVGWDSGYRHFLCNENL
jgi:hypothetical protein